MRTRVILETPYSYNTEDELRQNLDFARRCMLDSLNRGEAPLMFHLLYPTGAGGPLDDNDPEQRQLGVERSLKWYQVATAVYVYDDLGITPGMQRGIQEGSEQNVPVKFRTLKESEYRPDEPISLPLNE